MPESKRFKTALGSVDRAKRYTLAEAVNDLRARGYADELELTEHDGFHHRKAPLTPEDFRIDEYHRFEGPSDPADMSIVYAISSDKLGLKGLLVNWKSTISAIG